MLHHGAKMTWKLLQKHFPGHRIPFRIVKEFVEKCPRCQKDRQQMVADIQPVVRTVIPVTFRTRVGIDTEHITPPDDDGNRYAIVIVEQKTKHVAIYPTKEINKYMVATALFRYICTFGLYDEIISDMGTEFLNSVVAELTAWLGLRHIVALADVHESNGVERTNQEIIRHLRALVNDERIKNQWSKPHVLPLIEFALNSRVHTEAPHSAFELKFGTEDARYFHLPEVINGATMSDAWLQSLNQNLAVIRARTDEFQQQLIAERTRNNPPVELQNQYVAGDFVLYDNLYDKCRRRSEKLQNRYKGPYEVISQEKDEVTARHCAMGFVAKMIVERLTLFNGTAEDARRIAMEDADQFEVDRILAYKGNVDERSKLEFEVRFKDGDIVWKKYDQDLFDTEQFGDFCSQHSELTLIGFSSKVAMQRGKDINATPITAVQPGDIVYVDLRYFGAKVYDEQIDLPDKYHIKYLVEMRYTRWCGRNNRHLRIDGYVSVFDTVYELNSLFVLMWGSHKELSENWVEVTPQLLRMHPNVLNLVSDKRTRERLLKNL